MSDGIKIAEESSSNFEDDSKDLGDKIVNEITIAQTSAHDDLSETDNDGDSEEIEPKLKYKRMDRDLHSKILNQQSVACLAVHPKFVCVGTHWGHIYLLDHDGNGVLQRESSDSPSSVHSGLKSFTAFQGSEHEKPKAIPTHFIAVNQISIDKNGDFTATCSDDGRVHIHGLYSTENNHSILLGRQVKSIAIDPNYYKPGSGRRFVTGDERLVLHEKTFLSRLKSTVLGEAEGLVQNIKWNGQFIAWASSIRLRVYDINAKCSLGVIPWSTDSGKRLEDYRCNLCWKDGYTLLVGWVDRVCIYIIRRRIPQEITGRDLPELTVERTNTLRTDFVIAGLGPLGNQLVLLGYTEDRDEKGEAKRPALQVIEPHGDDYTEITTDFISLRGHEMYTCNNYHLECLVEENNFFVVSPKDIVVARPYDANDRVKWLMEHRKYEKAMDALKEPAGRCVRKYTLFEVGIKYLEDLIEKKEFDRAARLVPSIVGKDKTQWEEAVFKFAIVQQLRAVAKYLPRTEFRLAPSMYEMVMFEFLKNDAQGFLKLVEEWSPELYRVPVVTNAVLQHLVANSANLVELLKALALLYGHDKKYDMALSMYLKLRDIGVFELIQRYDIKGPIIHNLIPQLVELKPERAIAMLLEWDEKKNDFVIDPDIVVSKLSEKQGYLYLYLDELDKNPKNPARKFHGKLVQLYAEFCYEKLFPLLRRSDSYRISDALEICKEKQFLPEQEALRIITFQQNNIDQAIDFCKEHNDDELWEDLITYSLSKPEFITTLLQRIGTYVDPRILVQRMDSKVRIPGSGPELKNSLVKMMRDYKLQVSVQEGCKKILASDYFNLHEKIVKLQNRGIFVDETHICDKCHGSTVVNDSARVSSIVVFCCKHVFHADCLPSLDTLESCVICSSQRK